MAVKLSPRTLIVLIAVVVIALVFVGWIIVAYNGLVAKQQTAAAQWAQVENVFQRKIDLIPSLVATVTQYQQFERSTLENITAFRSQWQNASSLQQRVNISNTLNAQLYEIQLTYEAYPELQSITAVVQLMDELAGSENRITVERARYNDAVRAYNTQILSFPDLIIAGGFGFGELEYFNPLPGGP